MNKEIVKKIEDLTREKGFIYSLAWILLRDLFFDPEQVAHINWNLRLSYQELSFLVGLMVKNAFTVEFIEESICQDQVNRIYQLFQELHDAFVKPIKENISKDLEHPETSKSEKERFESIFGSGDMMAESIFYGDSGAYYFQFLDFAIKKYKKDREWLISNKGFQIETAIAVCKKLKYLPEYKYANAPKPSNFEEFCKMALSVFCFTKEDLHEFSDKELQNILKAFSVTPGTVNKNLSSPGEYNIINSHPIVVLGENLYFIPIFFNLAQSIYESPFYWMLLDEKYMDTSFKNRGEATVYIAFELLAKVFGVGNVYKQVDIEKSKKKILTDIDLLAVTGNKAVVFQIKSKKLTLLSRIGNEEKLKQDFLEAIQDSYDQAIISRNAILEKGNHLVGLTGQAVKLDDSINDIYILCITSDHYPAVTFQTRTFLKKKPTNPYPIAISIFDLDILTYYLKDPFEFLYYLKQRIALYNCFIAQTEMDLLAYHLKYKLYPLKDEKSGKPIDWVQVNDMALLIDAHFPAARGYQPKTKAMEKLHTKWSNPEFQEIINQLKKSKQPGFTDAIFLLHDLKGSGADEFMNLVKKLKNKCLREKKSLRLYMMGGNDKTAISYVCNYKNDGKLLRDVIEYCQIKKYQTKSDLCLGLGGIATSSRHFETVVFNKDPWVQDSQLEELSKKFFSKNRPMNLKSGEKIGRNDPCYCGSGLKYKKCHGK